MSEYLWAANQSKLQRALTALKNRNEKVTEESVRAEYVKIGGLVVEKTSGETAPKKRARKAAAETEEDGEDEEANDEAE